MLALINKKLKLFYKMVFVFASTAFLLSSNQLLAQAQTGGGGAVKSGGGGIIAQQPVALYTNGALDGTINVYDIEGNYTVSNSFSVTAASVLTGATFGIWNNGDTTSSPGPINVTLSIGTSANGTEVLGQIPFILNNVYQTTNFYGYQVFLSSVDLSAYNINVNASTTYWLTLTNATPAPPESGGSSSPAVGWDVTNAGTSIVVSDQAPTPNDSNYFVIYGNQLDVGVPEPSTYAFLGSGLAIAVLLGRARKTSEVA